VPAAKPKPVTPPIPTFAEGVKRGDAAWTAGELDAALYMYVLALQLSPNDALTFAKIGAIHESQGNYTVARQAFEKAHAADPKDARIAERLGLLYLRESKIDQSASLFEGALAREPGRWRSLDGMAEVARARGNLNDALRYDKTSRPDACRYLAEVLVRQHNNASAYEVLLRVMDMPSAYNRMGLILMSIPDYAAAADYFAKAVSASPGWNDAAQINLSVARERMTQAGTHAVAANAPN
jgi:tetratricopeptide (TPR) repeat protein